MRRVFRSAHTNVLLFGMMLFFLTGGTSAAAAVGADISPSPTATPPVSDPTATPTSAMGQAEEFFARGDANCSMVVSAPDVVATVLGVGTVTDSVCGNDDCDRDGEATTADVDCAARCLFGECPVPPHAPEVTSVVPETATDIVPYSAVRVIGKNFGAADDFRRVTFDGVQAEIAEETGPNELLVVVPPVGPGEAPLVVYRGDLGGVAFSVEVKPAASIGETDTFDGALDLLDEMVAAFSELDLESYYEDETEFVRDEIERFRQELEARRAEMEADPGYTPELRAVLDEAMQSSGVPERLRAVLAYIESLSGTERSVDGGVGAVDPITMAVGGVAQNVRLTMAVSRILSGATVALAAPAVGVSVPALVGVAALGVVAAVIATNVASGALAPVILKYDLFDASGQVSVFATPGGVIQLEAKRARPVSALTLIVKSACGGEYRLGAEGTAGDAVQFRFPAPRSGFCNQIAVQLKHTLTGTSGAEMIRVQPRLTGIDPSVAKPGDGLNMRALGALPCRPIQANFVGQHVFAEQPRCSNCLSRDFDVPNVAPGQYQVELNVAGISSAEKASLRIESKITDLQIFCNRTEIKTPPGSPDESNCTATFSPPGVELPKGTRVEWLSSNSRIGSIRTPLERSASVRAEGPGKTEITATLRAGEQVLLTSNPVQVEVRDESGPYMVILRTTSPLTVGPGDAIPLEVEARDHTLVSLIRLETTGAGALENPEQEFPCTLLEKTCTASFALKVKESGFTEKAISVVAEAFDDLGRKGTSNALDFTIKRDELCPQVTITSHNDGSTVNPGTTVRVEAQATDNRPGDTGVKRFKYSATGVALVQPVQEDLSFPEPVKDNPATLSFVFEVKDAAELQDVDRTITVSVEAFDDAAKPGNTCGPVIIKLTASAPPDVRVTLSWEGVEDLNLQVSVCDGFFCLLSFEGSPNANGRCQGTSNPVETVSLSGTDAPPWDYSVFVQYQQSCGAPPRSVPFTVHIEYDGNDVTVDTKQVEPFRGVDVIEFSRRDGG